MSHLGEKDFYDRSLVRQAQQERIQKGLFGGILSKEESIHFSDIQKGIDYKKRIADLRERRGENPDGSLKEDFDKGEDVNSDDAMFAKAESEEHKAKMKKVMDEFKNGTLKTSAGDKVTDRDQAIAIALSEAKTVEKAPATGAELSGLIKEHKKLINTLESPSHTDDIEEAKHQKKELKEYEKKSVEKAMTAVAGEGVTQKESVEHNPKDMQNPKPGDLKKAFEVLGVQL